MQYISVFLIISISIFSNINAQNTEEKLNKLREQLGKNQYDAYIIRNYLKFISFKSNRIFTV